MDRGAWRAVAHRIAESDMTEGMGHAWSAGIYENLSYCDLSVSILM